MYHFLPSQTKGDLNAGRDEICFINLRILTTYYMKDALLAMYIKTSTRIARKWGKLLICILWSAVANVENPFLL